MKLPSNTTGAVVNAPAYMSGNSTGVINHTAQPASDFLWVSPEKLRNGVEVKSHALPLPQERILAAEVNLGVIREMVPPEDHIGLQLCPFLDVPTDDVVFDFIKGAGTGLAPARAEDAESEMWQQDELVSGQGRASLIDWALKNHYTSSQVSGYRGFKEIEDQVRGNGQFPFYVRAQVQDFQNKLLRDAAERRRRIDNRIEWLIMNQALSTGKIVYNDGRISFQVDFGRPADQHNQAPASGSYAGRDHDPINDLLEVKQFMLDRYGVELDRAACSKKYLNTLYRSDKFIPLTGFLANQGVDGSDIPYLLPGFGVQSAIQLVQQETGIKFIPYDSVYRTKQLGGPQFFINRFMPENQVIFLPNEQQVAEYNNTELGFGRTLTSPHPMGNWTPSYYAWEQESSKDPWGYEAGTGIKAFPVFPVMETTYTWQVELPA